MDVVFNSGFSDNDVVGCGEVGVCPVFCVGDDGAGEGGGEMG